MERASPVLVLSGVQLNLETRGGTSPCARVSRLSLGTTFLKAASEAWKWSGVSRTLTALARRELAPLCDPVDLVVSRRGSRDVRCLRRHRGRPAGQSTPFGLSVTAVGWAILVP